MFFLLTNIFSNLLPFDKAVFTFINQTLTHPFLDKFFLFWREERTWYILYAFIIGFSIYKFKTKAWIFFVTAIATVALSDQISSQLLKPFFQRPRPCIDENFKYLVRLVDDCPTAFSFTSSHATNHFALALFFMSTLSFAMKRYKYLWLLWAFLVAYGQVYIGVHYPTDVIFGALIGIIVGTFTFYLYKQLHLKIYKILPPL